MNYLRMLPAVVFGSFLICTFFGWMYTISSTTYPPFPWGWVFVWTGILTAGISSWLWAIKDTE